MSIRIHLHPEMAHLVGGHYIVETNGNTIGKCIEQLIVRYPALKELVFYRDGRLQNFIEIYLNRKTASPDELSRKVEDGDDIHLIMMIAGG